jgi:hypothetical protein
MLAKIEKKISKFPLQSFETENIIFQLAELLLKISMKFHLFT